MIKIIFTAINTGLHGSPKVIMQKEYQNFIDINYLPKVEEEIAIQYGTQIEQSATFKVKNITKNFALNSDEITIFVENIE